MRHLNKQRGLTLIELMVGLTIAAFLAVSAAPYFAEYTSNSRLRESGNLLYGEALIAQSEAVKRNATVRLEVNGSTIKVIDRTVAATPVTLRENVFGGGVTATTASVDFGSEGRPVPFGSSGSVDLAMTGITCSGDHRCPGLRIDAGGAVRLCANQLSGC